MFLWVWGPIREGQRGCKSHGEVDSHSGAVAIVSKIFLEHNEAFQAVNLPRHLPLPTVTTIRKTLLVVWQFFLLLTIKTPTELFVGSAKRQMHSEFQIREDFGFQPKSDTREVCVCLSEWKRADMQVCVCVCVWEREREKEREERELGRQERWQETDEETQTSECYSSSWFFSCIFSVTSVGQHLPR